MSAIAQAVINAAKNLSVTVGRLKFREPVAFVYNPLDYAWASHEMYIRRFGATRKRVIFLEIGRAHV